MVQLASVRTAPVPAKKLLIISKKLHDDWRLDASAIEIAPGVTQNDIKNLTFGSKKSLGSVTLPDDTEWRWAGDFLAGHLTLISNTAKAFPGAWTVAGQTEVADKFGATPILPLKTEILEYLTAEYVRDNSSYREVAISGGRAAIEFKLVLPIVGGRTVAATRIYGGSASETGQDEGYAIDYQPELLPVVEVWPNFRHAGWRCYFLFWDNRGNNVLHARPTDPGRQTESFAEWEGDRKEREIFQLDGPPEFLMCSVTKQAAGKAPAQTDVGVLLPRLEPLPAQPASEYLVGVDFGTTNTNVYLRRRGGDDDPQPLEFMPSHQVSAATVGQRDESCYRFFLPPYLAETAPFLTFFRTRIGAPDADLQPVRHGHVLFYHPLHNHRDLDSARISTNLKWRDGDLSKVQCYLRQICLHAAAEAFQRGATNIHWSYSLPTALPLFKKNELTSIWIELHKWLNGRLGLASPPPVAQTESVVAAKYFASRRASGAQAFPAVGAVFMDVGGGTSDISIWQSNELRVQTSIRLSGDQILLRPLFTMRRQLLPVLPKSIVDEKRVQELQNTVQRAKFYPKMDALLRTEGDEIRQWLTEAPAEHAHWKQFIDCIGLGLCGLFYYTGLMARHLAEQGTFALASHNGGPPQLPGIHIGGNGSQLLHWVSRGHFTQSSLMRPIFRSMLVRAAGWPVSSGELNVQISDKPKAEAAYGLVTKLGLAASENFDETAFQSIISGEPFELDGKQMPATARVSREQLQRIRIGNLAALKDFIATYNGFAARPDYNLRPVAGVEAILGRVQNSLEAWLADQRERELAKIELEPLFVYGLKELLAQFADTEVR
jgi:hypothetical protein